MRRSLLVLAIIAVLVPAGPVVPAARAADATARPPSCNDPPTNHPTPPNPTWREREALSERPVTRLELNETRKDIDVWARFWWNPTLVRVVLGQEYQFTASGGWNDADIRSGPDGYGCDRWYFEASEWLRRAPHENWFALTCMVNRNPATLIAIGRERRWTATANGRLECFANDVPLTYWNNSGRVRLTVTRTK